MSTNRIFKPADRLSVVADHPTAPASGNPVRLGVLTGVALIDEGDSISGETTVDFGLAVYDLSVKGEDDLGNAAISYGDTIYYNDGDVGDGTGYLSVDSVTSGAVPFGIALEAVASGTTDTIQVLHVPSLVAAV